MMSLLALSNHGGHDLERTFCEGSMRKRNLQIAMAIVGLAPLITGALGFYNGARGPLYTDADMCLSVLLDSNLRYFHGMWFGAGLVTYWLIPRIERETALFRAIWFMVFLGAAGRIVSILSFGLPKDPTFLFLSSVELLGAPVFVYWQHRVAKAAGTDWGTTPQATARPIA
jgi:hypothetical protein